MAFDSLETRPVAATSPPTVPIRVGINPSREGRRPTLTGPRSGRSSPGRGQDRAAQKVTDVAAVDRLDALVWAVTELTARVWQGPRIRAL